jgi:hypothetical protein
MSGPRLVVPRLEDRPRGGLSGIRSDVVIRRRLAAAAFRFLRQRDRTRFMESSLMLFFGRLYTKLIRCMFPEQRGDHLLPFECREISRQADRRVGTTSRKGWV